MDFAKNYKYGSTPESDRDFSDIFKANWMDPTKRSKYSGAQKSNIDSFDMFKEDDSMDTAKTHDYDSAPEEVMDLHKTSRNDGSKRILHHQKQDNTKGNHILHNVDS